MSGIRLRLTGLNFHHLFSRAKRENVSILSSKRIDNRTLEIVLLISDYNSLKQYLHKFYHVEEIGYTGRRAIRPFLIKNIGYIVGIFIACLVAFLSTQFVWRIEIYGLENTPRQEVISALHRHNIKVGRSFNTDISSLESQLLQELSTIADISITKKGTTILVSVSEKLVFSPTTFDPIISDYTGIVQSINLLSGTLAVNTGDFVQKGDILVMPFILDNTGREVSVRPVAQVQICAQVTGVSSMSAREKVLTYTGRELVRTYYKLGKFNLSNVKIAKPFDFCEKIVYNQCVSRRNILPLYKVSVVYKEYQIDFVERNLNDIKELIIRQSEESAKRQTLGDILTTDTTIIEIADVYYATTTMTFIVEQS